MSPSANRRRSAAAGIGIGVVVIAAAAWAVIGGRRATIPMPPPGTVVPPVSTLSLLASRDMGRLPARGTGDGQWCGANASASLAAPAHCWQTGADGTLSDLGTAATKWDLSKLGSPRTGISVGVAVDDGAGAVSWSSETAGQGTSTSDCWRRTSTTVEDAAAISVTVLYAVPPGATSNPIFQLIGSTYYWGVTANTSNTLAMQVVGPGGTKTMTASLGTLPAFNPGYRCCTLVADRSGPNLGKVFCDRVDRTPATHNFEDAGSLASAGATAYIGRGGAGPVPRLRVDYSALTQAKHSAICGTWGWPLYSGHASFADSYWVHSSAATYGRGQCYKIAAHRAACFDAGESPAMLDGGSVGWKAEPPRMNRILRNGAPVCGTGWTCTTATMAAAEAPDGLLSAGAITMGGGSVDVAGTGYTAGAVVYPRLWAKCSTGTLTVANQAASGSFSVNCTTLAGQWGEIFPGGAAVTVDASPNDVWHADGSGAVTVRFSGADASVWMPTVTMVDGDAVLPVSTTAYASTAARFEIANVSSAYYQPGDTKVDASTDVSGDCVQYGPTLRLTGNPSSPCRGVVHSVEISGSPSRNPAVLVFLAGQSNAVGNAQPSVDPVPAPYNTLPMNYDYWEDGVPVGAFGLGYYNQGLYYYGAEPWITHTLAARFPNQPVVFVKRAIRGRSLYVIWYYVWDAGRAAVTSEVQADYQFDHVVADVAAILRGQTPRRIVLVWIQGEKDAQYATAAADYAAGLDRFVSHLETSIGHQVDQLVISRIGPTSFGDWWPDVRAAQDAAVAARPGGATTVVIDTDAMEWNPVDLIHLSALGLSQDGAAIGAVITP